MSFGNTGARTAGSTPEFCIDPAKARDAFAGDLSDQEAALIEDSHVKISQPQAVTDVILEAAAAVASVRVGM